MIPDSVKPLIAGASMIPFRKYDDGSNFRDWIRKVGRDAIDAAGIERNEIDSVVVASESDMFSLQVSPAALVVDELGLHGASAVHVEMGGASGAAGIREGFMQVCSGAARHVLVCGFDQTASRLSGAGVKQIYSWSFDADIEGWTGVSTASLYALSFQSYCNQFQATPEQAALVSVKNHGNAMNNPYAHKPMKLTVNEVRKSRPASTPYRLLDCSMVSDGAAAVVLSSPKCVPLSKSVVRISGSGSSTDYAKLGDRPHTYRFAAKFRSASKAYSMAGVKDPSIDIDIAEIYDAFSGAELQGIEALLFSAEGRAGPDMENGDFDVNGRIPINVSGGLIGQGGAPGATGVAQAVTMYRLLNGNYESALQPDKQLRRGVIDSHSGICTASITHVLERVEGD